MTNRRHTIGFTLIELALVAVIVGVLATLSIAATRQAVGSLKTAGCLDNLRQWGLATQFYTMDNNAMLPREGSPNGASRRYAWYVSLPPYLDLEPYHEQPWRTNPKARPSRSGWICPTNKRRSNGANLFHYCLNGHVDGRGDNDLPTQIHAYARPQRLVWLYDNGGLAAVAGRNNAHTNLHRGGAHFGLLDGSVRHHTAADYMNTKTDAMARAEPVLQWVP